MRLLKIIGDVISTNALNTSSVIKCNHSMNITGTVKTVNTTNPSPVILLTAAAPGPFVLNSAKIIGDVTKPAITSLAGAPVLVKEFGSCYYSSGAPVNITEAPSALTFYAGLE